MNADQKELFDLGLLRVLDANRTRFGLGIVALGHHLTPFGFTAANCGGPEKFHELIADRLEYLTNKQMIVETLKVVSKENRAWRIEAAGIRYVDERG